MAINVENRGHLNLLITQLLIQNLKTEHKLCSMLRFSLNQPLDAFCIITHDQISTERRPKLWLYKRHRCFLISILHPVHFNMDISPLSCYCVAVWWAPTRKWEKERPAEEWGKEHTIIKASFLQRTIKSRPKRAAEHKSISFSRLQALRF